MTDRNDSCCATAPQQTETVVKKTEACYTPSTDLYEVEGGWVLKADLPGVNRSDLDLQIDKGVLTLEATARTGQPGRCFHQEFNPATFYRRFDIGDLVNVENIDARLENGVLTLLLPMAEAVKPRKIKVNLNA